MLIENRYYLLLADFRDAPQPNFVFQVNNAQWEISRHGIKRSLGLSHRAHPTCYPRLSLRELGTGPLRCGKRVSTMVVFEISNVVFGWRTNSYCKELSKHSHSRSS